MNAFPLKHYRSKALQKHYYFIASTYNYTEEIFIWYPIVHMNWSAFQKGILRHDWDSDVIGGHHLVVLSHCQVDISLAYQCGLGQLWSHRGVIWTPYLFVPPPSHSPMKLIPSSKQLSWNQNPKISYFKVSYVAISLNT